ncbi:MAG: nucleoside hydrolase [Alphaproteobacteria bacterium]|nr:nucleoside hydrolase [Alphaproteobacteria bacterium]
MHLRPFIIDCDTGRDDALAIFIALRRNLPLIGVVASYGNSSLAKVMDNTARILSFANHDEIPLFAGSAIPMRDHFGFRNTVLPRQAISGNGLCNLQLPISHRQISLHNDSEDLAREISKMAQLSKGPIDYIITGPATTFASICQHLSGKVKDVISSVTMMGGKLDPLWTKFPCADFNLISDPFAVHEIMKTGIPIRFVPMNATWPIKLVQSDIEKLVPLSKTGDFAQKLMIEHCKNFASEPIFRFHDPSVIMAAENPSFFKNNDLDINLAEQTADFSRLIECQNGFKCQTYEPSTELQSKFLKEMLDCLDLSFTNLSDEVFDHALEDF